jgi:hypothetical protein
MDINNKYVDVEEAICNLEETVGAWSTAAPLSIWMRPSNR